MPSSWFNQDKSPVDIGNYLILFFITSIFLVFFPGGVYNVVHKRNWLQTDGTIVNSELYGRGKSNLRISYKYKAGNDDRLGEGTLFLLFTFPMKSKIQKYYPGAPINVYYNPNRPQESSLRKTIDPFVLWISLLLMPIAVCGIIRHRKELELVK